MESLDHNCCIQWSLWMKWPVETVFLTCDIAGRLDLGSDAAAAEIKTQLSEVERQLQDAKCQRDILETELNTSKEEVRQLRDLCIPYLNCILPDVRRVECRQNTMLGSLELPVPVPEFRHHVEYLQIVARSVFFVPHVSFSVVFVCIGYNYYMVKPVSKDRCPCERDSICILGLISNSDSICLMKAFANHTLFSICVDILSLIICCLDFRFSSCKILSGKNVKKGLS